MRATPGWFEEQDIIDYFDEPSSLSADLQDRLARQLVIHDSEWDILNPTATTAENQQDSDSETEEGPNIAIPNTLWPVYLQCEGEPDRLSAINQFIQRNQLNRIFNAEEIESLSYKWDEEIPQIHVHLRAPQRRAQTTLKDIPVRLQEPEIKENYILEL